MKQSGFRLVPNQREIVSKVVYVFQLYRKLESCSPGAEGSDGGMSHARPLCYFWPRAFWADWGGLWLLGAIECPFLSFWSNWVPLSFFLEQFGTPFLLGRLDGAFAVVKLLRPLFPPQNYIIR